MSGDKANVLPRLHQGYLAHVVADSRRLAPPARLAPTTNFAHPQTASEKTAPNPIGKVTHDTNAIEQTPTPMGGGSYSTDLELPMQSEPSAPGDGPVTDSHVQSRNNSQEVSPVSTEFPVAPMALTEDEANSTSRPELEPAKVVAVPTPTPRAVGRTVGRIAVGRNEDSKTYRVKQPTADNSGEDIFRRNAAAPPPAENRQAAIQAEGPAISHPGMNAGESRHAVDAGDKSDGPVAASPLSSNGGKVEPTELPKTSAGTASLPAAQRPPPTPVTFEAGEGPRRRGRHADRDAGPRVQIGSVDVHVVLDEPEAPREMKTATAPQPYQGSSLASRLYQRRL